ncbi:phospholipase D-like domain-containing protein [Celeribacter ethanolicus]|uniref:phospholipase D-like domain-containing protein n=1 Tax=Celeribacter ethanolicus TaxID=1758178 RepID=UPI00083046F1|nr:phospholipase D-like domain-containing protein [Celeribacter ethanolicus]
MLDRQFSFEAPRTETVSQIGRPLGMAWVPQLQSMSKPLLGGSDLLPADASRRLEGALVKMIGAAQEMVVLCSFLLASDRLSNALEAAARRGVRVYMMLASEARLGQEREEDDFSKHCRKHHEEMLRQLAPHAMIRSAAHYHAKTVLIDPNRPNAQGWLLTANLTDEALSRNEELGLCLTPEEVRSVFLELRHAIWERAEHRISGTDFRPARSLGAVDQPPAGLALVTSPPRHSIQDTALDLIEGAKGQIIVSSFGWALDHPVTQALIGRAKAGVEVTVLARIRPAAMPALTALAEAGAEVYGFNWLHAKAIWTAGDRAMIMTANLECHGMDDGFELGLSLYGKRAESLRHILKGWEGTAPYRFELEAKVTPDLEQVKLWKDGGLKDLEIAANRSVDLGTVEMRSLTDLLPERPALPAEPPLARELTVTWRIDPPRVATRAIHIDANGKELKKAKEDKTPMSWPAWMREPSGRRVVVVSDLAQLDEAKRLAETTRAKAVVMNRSVR